MLRMHDTLGAVTRCLLALLITGRTSLAVALNDAGSLETDLLGLGHLFNETDWEELGNNTLSPREVYSPRITNPTSSTVWVIGHSATVTWDTSSLPPSASNSKGRLVLGHEADGETNEHLDNEHPLATDFPLSKGSVKVRVPNVEQRNDYIVVLFGDSGNKSPQFTIN